MALGRAFKAGLGEGPNGSPMDAILGMGMGMGMGKRHGQKARAQNMGQPIAFIAKHEAPISFRHSRALGFFNAFKGPIFRLL